MSAVPSSAASRRSSQTGRRVAQEDSDESENEQSGATAASGRGRQTSDGVEVTPRRSPTKNTQSSRQIGGSSKSTSRRSAIVEEIDENDNAGQNGTAADTPTASIKKRRLSKSGRATVIPDPEHEPEPSAADEEVEDQEDDDATPPPPSTKTKTGPASRRKSNVLSSAQRVEDDDDEDRPVLNESGDEAEEQKAVKKQAKLIRDPKDGYVMGSVVRIKCVNFLTYSNAECHPGPNLNMIIGPNGSGKSTVAAAIAIGLGFPPKVMGRSSALKNFVRENQKEGHVEIELKGRPGKRNMVITRYLNSSNNSSKFEINGKDANKEAVVEAVADLNVNVNNLCSFLPQDRVKEFAQLSGAELLKETQRVVDPRLLVRQEQLVKMKERYAKANKELEKNEEELTEKDRKLKSMEKDVKRHKERQKVEDQALIQEVCLPYMQYIEEKNKHDKAKKERNNAREKIVRLKEENAPLLEQKRALEMLVKETDRRFKAITKRYNETGRAQTNIEQAILRNEGDVDKLRETLKQLKAAEVKRKKELAETEAAIVKLQKAVDEGPPEAVPAELADRMRAATDKLRVKTAEITECSEVHNACCRDIDNANHERKRTVESLEALNDVYKRKEDQCMKEDPKLWAATKWCRANKRQFKGQVYDPVRLLVSVKDRRHAKAAEAAINYNTFKTILVHEKEDYSLLAGTFPKFRTERGEVDLRMNIAQLMPEQRSLDSYPRACSQEELNALGFDCFVLDLIDGPEDALAYLCLDANVHRIPVAFDNGQRIQHDRLKHPDCPIKRYITNNTVTNISFSRYGNKAPIVQDVPIREPRLFAETIDQNRKRDLELRLAEADSQIKDLQAARDAQIQKDEGLRDEHAQLRAAKNEIDKEKKEIERLILAFEKRKVELRSTKTRHADLLQRPSEEHRRQKISKDLAKLASTRLEAARRLPACAGDMLKCQTAQARVACASLQAAADFNAVDKAINETNDEVAEAAAAFQAANADYLGLKATAQALWKTAEEEKQRIPDRLGEAFQDQVQHIRPADEVVQALEALRAELAMSDGISPAVVRKYEELKEVVEALRTTVDEQKTTTRAASDKIHQLMLNWVDPVKAIIETVNRNFSRAMESFGCAGEVSLNSEDEDYSKWSVKIMVAFRDAEDLTELTAQRQSGGERSLTTMTYLISLLELSQVPFSMVDEINQGMDGRAERAIHDTLVAAVCNRSDMGQYFLLTPKLLTGLQYAENMRILVVNNGDWIPEDLPLRAIIRKRLERVRGR